MMSTGGEGGVDVSGAVFADRCPAHRAENVWNAHRPSEISRLTARRTTGDEPARCSSWVVRSCNNSSGAAVVERRGR